MPSLNDLVGTVPLVAWPITVGVALLVALVAVITAVRTGKRRAGDGVAATRRGGLTTVLTTVAAVIATGASSQGMYNFFGDQLHVHGPLRWALFALFEIALIVFALNARANMRTPGSSGAGFDGVAVWVLAGITGVLSALDADSVPAVLARLLVPLVAAMLWERDLILQLRAARAERARAAGTGGSPIEDTKIRWRITPQRVLVRLGLADSSDVTAAELDTSRWLLRLARSAYRYHSMRKAGARTWRVDRAQARLRRHVQAASRHLALAHDAEPVERFRTYLAAFYEVENQTTAEAVADASPWRPADARRVEAELAEMREQLAATQEVARSIRERGEAELASVRDELIGARQQIEAAAVRAAGEGRVPAERRPAELPVARTELNQERAVDRGPARLSSSAEASTPAAGGSTVGGSTSPRPGDPSRGGVPAPVGRSRGAALPAARPASEPVSVPEPVESLKVRVYAALDELAPGDSWAPREVAERIAAAVADCSPDTAARYYRTWRVEIASGLRPVPAGRRLRVVPDGNGSR